MPLPGTTHTLKISLLCASTRCATDASATANTTIIAFFIIILPHFGDTRSVSCTGRRLREPQHELDHRNFNIIRIGNGQRVKRALRVEHLSAEIAA